MKGQKTNANAKCRTMARLIHRAGRIKSWVISALGKLLGGEIEVDK